MVSSESCKFCEKIVIVLESTQLFDTLRDVPNTFDPATQRYSWRQYEEMHYAIIPRQIDGNGAEADLFICMDEDDLDDLDLLEYADGFLRSQIFSQWGNFKSARLMEPGMSKPDDIACWKQKEKTGA